MTIQDVAEHLQMSWDTIKDIQARSLQRRFGKPKLHKLTQIAIDEIAIGKGHRYVTVVLNLLTSERGRSRDEGDGHSAAANRRRRCVGPTQVARLTLVTRASCN